jgi:hypothetical protein
VPDFYNLPSSARGRFKENRENLAGHSFDNGIEYKLFGFSGKFDTMPLLF